MLALRPGLSGGLLASHHLLVAVGVLANRLARHLLASHCRPGGVTGVASRGGGGTDDLATALLATLALDLVGILALGTHALLPVDVGRGVGGRIVANENLLLTQRPQV